MSNPHSPQNEINRIPLLTCADYAYNPRAYDPARSIGQAILQLSDTPAQRAILKELVELYPGDLICGSTSTAYNPFLERISALVKEPGGRKLAKKYLRLAENALVGLVSEFPGRYEETKRTLDVHMAKALEIMGTRHPSGKAGQR